MCIGIPLQVLERGETHAWCEADGHRERLDMGLVGPLAAGTWVLAFQGAARHVMGEQEAARARAARQALRAVLSGSGSVDAFFADLVGREPQLPPHLQTPAQPQATP